MQSSSKKNEENRRRRRRRRKEKEKKKREIGKEKRKKIPLMCIEISINGEIVTFVDEDEPKQLSRHQFSFLGFYSFIYNII